MADIPNALATLRRAEAYLANSRFSHELKCRGNVGAELTESEFLCECAWVVLCSGFRESTIRGLFSQISLCFCDWESASVIVKYQSVCRSTALEVFAYPAKIDAILSTASLLARRGYANYRRWFSVDPIRRLQGLAFIGPVTAYHLAKNLGFDVAKPDRHLQRLAISLGFSDAHALCEELSTLSGHPKAIVDSILWRYLSLGVDGAASHGQPQQLCD